MKVLQIIGLTALLFILVACGQQDSGEQTGKQVEEQTLSVEELLTQRAEDRWQAVIAWDMEKAYGYLSPGTRQSLPLQVYAKKNLMGPVQYKDAVVKSTQCEEQVCTLKLDLHYLYQGSISAMQGTEMSSAVTEKWVKADNNWFYVPD